MKEINDIIEEQVDRTVSLLQENGFDYSIIVLKGDEHFSAWCRTQDDAMCLLMAAIILRSGRQDVAKLADMATKIDMGKIDTIVEEVINEESY